MLKKYLDNRFFMATPSLSMLSSFEVQELTGIMMSEEMALDPSLAKDKFVDILQEDEFHLHDLISAYLENDTPENGHEILDHIKKLFPAKYKTQISKEIDQHDINRFDDLKKNYHLDNNELYYTRS